MLDWSPKFEVMASSMRCDGVARLDGGRAASRVFRPLSWEVGPRGAHFFSLADLLSREAQRVSKSPLVGRNAVIKLLRDAVDFNFCGGWSCVLSGERLQPIRS